MSIIQWIIRAIEMVALICILKAIIKDLRTYGKTNKPGHGGECHTYCRLQYTIY